MAERAAVEQNQAAELAAQRARAEEATRKEAEAWAAVHSREAKLEDLMRDRRRERGREAREAREI